MAPTGTLSCEFSSWWIWVQSTCEPSPETFESGSLGSATMRTFLEPKAPQNQPEVHYSICPVSTAHHYMSDMYVHDCKCGNVFQIPFLEGPGYSPKTNYASHARKR